MIPVKNLPSKSTVTVAVSEPALVNVRTPSLVLNDAALTYLSVLGADILTTNGSSVAPVEPEKATSPYEPELAATIFTNLPSETVLSLEALELSRNFHPIFSSSC